MKTHMRLLFFAIPAAFASLLMWRVRDAESLRGQIGEKVAASMKAQRDLEGIESSLAEVNRRIEEADRALRDIEAGVEQPRAERVGNASAPSEGPTVRAGREESSTDEAPFVGHLMALGERAAQLDQHVSGLQEFNIPEISLLREADWVHLARQYPGPDTPENIRAACEGVVKFAKNKAVGDIFSALNDLTVEETLENDRIDSELRGKLSEEILQRYEVLKMEQWGPEILSNETVQYFMREQKFMIMIRDKEGIGGKRMTRFILSNDGKNFTGVGSIPEE